jgi:2-C-methyl-D-erythritol 2,4-cyclodiphosphate synthase/2-C-methyl-D-erythritol 4-phosphate cytidylyltransferase
LVQGSYTSAIIVAGGSGVRMHTSSKKQYLELEGTPILVHTLLAFTSSNLFDEIVVVLPKEDILTWGEVLKKHLASSDIRFDIVAGGDSRQESVYNGIKSLGERSKVVAIHDGVRPFVSTKEIEAVIEAAKLSGASTLATKLNETIKRANWGEKVALESIDREALCATKTPQAFATNLIKKAHENAIKDGYLANDDCELLERMGHKIVIIEGSSDNIKITTKEDLIIAGSILEKKNMRCDKVPSLGYRSGIGYDAHRLVANRPLVLGGVVIPFDKGLLGHSDADVVLHAICDALLGAAALSDIGVHFPDDKEEYEGISSLILLKKVSELLRSKNFGIMNIDVTIVAEAPKLAPFFSNMVKNISETMAIDEGMVNIKATTTEGMGFCGVGEGICAYAIATLNTL